MIHVKFQTHSVVITTIIILTTINVTVIMVEVAAVVGAVAMAEAIEVPVVKCVAYLVTLR